MSARGGDEGLLERVQALEDKVRQLEQGVGLSSLTFRRIRLTDRTGRGKYEISPNGTGLAFYDLVSGAPPLVLPIPEGFNATTGSSNSEIIFGVSGALIPATTSGPWSPGSGISCTTITSQLFTPGSTSSVVTININNIVWQTLTFTAGISRLDLSAAGYSIAPTDSVTASIGTAGTGAANLTIQLRYFTI